ncbi:MAG: ABC transporter ATP-binding protein [Tenericutes bacterium]|nr:ABC transporter ATP-binding protein [Mycoplasmatota bacterium]
MDNYKNISITINEVTKEYNKGKGIKAVSTLFESGILNLVVGENGSGKSTLFKCIMGLVSYSGSINKRKIKMGYAPEEYVMPLRMSVVDFLYSIGRIKGLDRDLINNNLETYLRYFDLYPYKNKLIGSLSNGMRQKLNLMQAFVHEPKIIILDEPLAALDEDTIHKVIKIIKEKAKTKLVVVSTHQPNKFKCRNKRIYRFEKGNLIND